MSHAETESELLRRGAAEMGLGLDGAQARLMLQHLDLLETANRQTNLTAAGTLENALALHVLDSLAACREVRSAPHGTIVDIGTGGGFPGIPISIALRRRVILCESVGKKARFLRDTCERLGVDAEVWHGRSEDLAAARPSAAGCVVARAVAELPALVELASPLLMPGGILIALKGRSEESEIDRGKRAGLLCGMGFMHQGPVTVPGLDAARSLVAFRREGRSDVSLPRRAGMASKRPLA